MKKFLKIVTIFCCITSVNLLSSGKRNQGRLPNLVTIENTKFPESESQKIINNSTDAINYYYTTYNDDKESALERLESTNWKLFIQELTTYNHRSLINNDHKQAIQLYTLLKKHPHVKTSYNLTEHDIDLLQDCSTWALVDAIALYYQKQESQSPITELLPSVEILRDNVQKEIITIPNKIYSYYRQNQNHALAKFQNEEAERKNNQDIATINKFYEHKNQLNAQRKAQLQLKYNKK